MRSASLFVGAAVPELWTTNRRSKQPRDETSAAERSGAREAAAKRSRPMMTMITLLPSRQAGDR